MSCAAVEHYDVAIVGYGPVGAAMACKLALAGHRVLLIERTDSDLSKVMPRAINLDDGSQSFLVQDLGLADWEASTMAFPGGHFVVGHPPNVQWLGIGTTSDDPGNPLFGHVEAERRSTGFPCVTFYMPELMRQLQQRVSELSGITLWPCTELASFDTTLESARVSVRCHQAPKQWVRRQGEWCAVDVADSCVLDKEFTCSYLIGCDGARSFIRRVLTASLNDAEKQAAMSKSMGYFEQAAGERYGELEKPVFCTSDTATYIQDVEHRVVIDTMLLNDALIGRSLPQVAQQVCDTHRPGAIIPGSWVWDSPERSPDGMPPRHYRWEFMIDPETEDPDELVKDSVVQELLTPWVSPADVRIIRAAVYRIRASDAFVWQKGRVFIAGDAAHTTTPQLGQGLNQGFRDVRNLSWKLDFVLRGVASEALLDTYQQEMQPIACFLAVGAHDVGKKKVLFNEATKSQESLEALMQQLADSTNPNTYGHKGGKWGAPVMPAVCGELIAQDHSKPFVGRILPQPYVEGQPRLYDSLGNGFAVVYNSEKVFHDELEQELSAMCTKVQIRLVPVQLHQTGDSMSMFDAYDLVIVRPDRIVYDGARVDKARELLASFSRVQSVLAAV